MARILVIDDDDLIRLFVKQIVESAGHEVAEAENGAYGIRLLKARPFDAIITDIFMPDMDGLETIRELRKDHPTLKIIAMSSGGQIGSSDYLEMARRFGADKVIAKPFVADQLLDCLNTCLADSA